MNKKKVKKQNSISMEKFLRDYYHIESENVIDMLSNLSHKELKKVCRKVYKIRLLSLPFEMVSMEEVSRGEIVFVNDAFYNSAPYRNPKKMDIDEIMSHNPRLISETSEMEYDEIIDSIEDNLTLEEVKIKSIGTFNVKGRR